MALATTVTIEDGIGRIILVGEADAEAAPALDRLIASTSTHHLTRLVLDVTALTYLSSAGLRSLVFAHQRLGRGVIIVLVGASVEVAKTIRLTGFDNSIIMQDSVS